jgi:hypothetical protein
MTTTADRYETETRSLLHRLMKAGFTPLTVNNGASATKWNADDRTLFIEEAMACDEATLRCVDQDGRKVALFLVYGNGPGELVCDFTDTPALAAVVDAHYAAHNR